MKVSNLRIGVRLGFAFTLVIALLIGTAVVGIAHLDASDTTMRQIVSGRYSLIALSNEIKNNGNRANGILSKLLLATSAEQSARYMDAYAVIRKTNADAYGQLEKLLTSDASKALFKEQIDARSAYGASVKQFFALMRDNKLQEARELYQGDMTRLQDAYYVLVDKMVEHQARAMDQDVADAAAQVRNAQIQMSVLSVFAVLLAIATGFVITRSITRPINRALHLAEAVAQGNLTHDLDVDCTDEIGQLLAALKQMVGNLHGIVEQVRTGTDTIARASCEVASGNTDLSGRTERQAASLEQTAAAMEQLTSTVKQNAENANEANQLASNTSGVATKGGEAVARVVNMMSAINDSSRKIVEIIGVIDGIAFQTNILALNAAVEAARAGEHGRGFAVVASEVRGLAQRSAVAAKEIKALIDNSVSQVDSGAKTVGQTGQIIHEVVASIERLTHIVAEISASSQEQSDGIEQVNQAITQMDRATQENASLVEQSAAAAQALQHQADQLTAMVSAFKLDKDVSSQKRLGREAALRSTIDIAPSLSN